MAGSAGVNYTSGTAGTEGVDLIIGDWAGNTLSGGLGDDVIDGWGGVGNDTLNGGDGHDWLFCRGGDDTLNGEAGNDTLDGGAGNDFLDGGTGNNTYAFGRGDGSDSIRGWLSDASAGKLNTLQFKAGVAPADLVLRQVWSSYWAGNAALEVAIVGTPDKIVIDSF